MSRQKQFIRFSLVGLFLFSVLANLYRVKKLKRSAKSERSSTIKQHAASTSPEEALKYWTAEKMRKAQPAPMPNVKKPEHENQDQSGS